MLFVQHRIARLLTLFTIAALAGLGLTPAFASAASVPFTDPAAAGYIGFCDAQDHQITSGSTTVQPFVVKAVSSTAAPKNYGRPYGRATLYVYQPIQYVDPGNWSGKQMTGATAFSNDAAPMAVGTIGDPSMVNFSYAFPLHYQGLAQLRIYFTTPGQVQHSSPYPAAVIQVKGTTWTQLGGGKVNCKAGKARSNELNVPAISRAASSASAAAASSAAHASASGSTGGTGSTNAGGSSASSSNGASASKKSSSSSSGLLIGLVIAGIVVAGGAVYVGMRRRNRLLP